MWFLIFTNISIQMRTRIRHYWSLKGWSSAPGGFPLQTEPKIAAIATELPLEITFLAGNKNGNDLTRHYIIFSIIKMKMMLTNVKGDVHLNVYLRVKTAPAATFVELTFVHQSMPLIHIWFFICINLQMCHSKYQYFPITFYSIFFFKYLFEYVFILYV